MAGITAIYISATTFTIVGNQTSVFNIGRRIRATCSDVYKYGTIESSTYTSLTTVVLTATSDDLNSGLTEVYYGIQADSTGSLPTHAHDTTEGEGGVLTFIGLSDTPVSYEDGKFLQSTSSGTDWVSGAGGTFVHSELSNLAYAASGHTGFSPTSHSHTESDISDLDKYTQSEVDTISGSLNTKIDGKSDTGHTHDDRYYTESEVDTISGSLQTNIEGKADVVHTHDDRYYTETELNAGQLDNRYYTESEVDTISGSLQTGIDTHGHISTEITVSKINTPTYETLQDWINNTQSSGRMSGGATTAHTDTITDVTVGGAGSGEFKVAGDQTACYIAAEPILVEGSTNNDGYYTIASGVVYSGGKTTIPVEEAVGAVADGIIYNGTVNVSDGTGFIKQTDSDIAETVSFDIHADTNITLTDVTTNYLYIDYNSGTPDIKVTTDRDSIEYNKQFTLAMVYRNGPRIWAISSGVYLPNFLIGNHERLLIARGYERASGGEISEYGTRNIQSTSGVFFRGATRVDTVSKVSVDDKLTTVYYNGADWVWTENETQIDNTYYNNIASGLVELGVSKYAVHWVCIDYLSNLYVVYGRGSYSLAEAQLAGVPSLMPVVSNEFGIVAAKVIIQKTAASFAELISAYTQLIPTATPAVHNNLSGLNEGDYKHLTAVNHTDLTDSGNTTLHKHDDRYYTESEVDTISGSLNTKIEAKPDTLLELSDTPSEYDDNKYLRSTTSGTIWATVSGGTGTSDHSELSNLDYASAGHTGFAESSHSHTESDISDLDKYSQSEVDTISGTLSSEIDSDISTHASNTDAHHSESHTVVSHSDTTATGANLNELVGSGDTTLHKHDGQYYTESEIDTISGSLNTKIDGKDNYTSWSFAVDGETKDDITAGDVLDFVGGDNITITRSADDQITISGSVGSGISNIVEDTTPELGGQLGVGEHDIKLDALLSADGKYSGTTRDGVLGATLAFGDLVYLNTTDQRWELANANAEATSGGVTLAIVLASGDDGDTRLLLTEGYVREDDWNFTDYGKALYVSTTTGDMTQTVASGSGDILRVVGFAETTANEIHFKSSENWLEFT